MSAFPQRADFLALSLPKSLWNARAIALGAAAAAFAIVLFTPAVLNDADTYWHIAAGRWMIDNQTVLRIDLFSYTFAGHPWQTHEWLAEIVMALAYVGAGWGGVMLLFGAAAALTAGLLAHHLSPRLSGLSLVATLALSLACVAGSLLARPHLLALPLLEIWTAGLVIARAEGRAPSWKLLPVLALWANLHASFLLGLALIVPFALEAVWDDDKTRVRTMERWALFALLALLAALLTPFGIEGLILPFRLMAMPSLNLISEWAPTNFQTFQPLGFAAAAALYVLLSRGAKVKPLRIAILLALLYMALAHVRHQMLIAIVGPLILAEPLAEALKITQREDKPRNGFAAALIFAVVITALGGLRLWLPLIRGNGVTTPATAFESIPASLARTPVLNDYAFGGYLIFNDVRPFIDSRAELYGEKFIGRYLQMVGPDKALLAATLAKYHVHWTIFAADNPAVGAMDTMKGWHRLYADRWAVVHVRDDAK
ncbi:MAG: hypothetical protein KGL29_04780 [Alphaproteobacteria bacterium]|nr:hypothetical protein [Alphaproteobacteria bacterium]MDE2161696.1 hypothetical protein [Alphaproteobacteria bacterium]MDE2265192.1 hypothetical protein [Alphaproteobacteria bacterium]